MLAVSLLRQFTLYLPIYAQIRLLSVGIDDGCHVEAAKPFVRDKPIVLYGSSIAQGNSAARPGMSYQAIVARTLNLDYVNLGFSGGGKAEPQVVSLVADVPACCYLFDLGKSYGLQTGSARAKADSERPIYHFLVPSA